MRYFLSSLAKFSGLSLILVMGCSQNNQPSQSEIIESLEDRLPSYSEVASFKIEKIENLGTETEPKIQARFIANLKINEDLFQSSLLDGVDMIMHSNSGNTKLISKTKSEGDKIKLYGLSVSEQYTDTWKTDFKFEENPFAKIGVPRSTYKKQTIIKGSGEEKKLKQEFQKELEKFQKNTLSSLFKTSHKGHLETTFSRSPFIIDFTTYDPKTGYIEGRIAFKTYFAERFEIVKNIQGKFSNSKISFKTTSYASGEEKDRKGLGTEYSIDLNLQDPRQHVLIGTWRPTDQSIKGLEIQLN